MMEKIKIKKIELKTTTFLILHRTLRLRVYINYI